MAILGNLPFALFLVGLLVQAPFASAQDGLRREWQEVVTPRTRVLFDDPAIAPYAAQVAIRAEAALTELSRLFGTDPPLTTIELDAHTDSYGAIAPPLPRPRVVLPALFPALPEVDLRARDPLYTLLLHELTHTLQLSFLERPAGVAELPRLGVVGEAVAPLPPGWLLEGLAVWLANTLSPGSPEVDARTRGVLHSLALEGAWPTLADASLLSHSRWPGGETRYLLGGAFVGYLVEHQGWDSLLAALREANAGWYPLPFEEAWRRANGTELEELWWHWGLGVEEQALARAAEEQDEGSRQLTRDGRASTVLALDPTGEKVAWRPAAGGLVVSSLAGVTASKEVEAGVGALGVRERVLPRRVWPLDVTWVSANRLVYSRLAPEPDSRFIDLFELDIESGRAERLTHGARARFPRGLPGGCVLYARDVTGEGSTLWRRCSEGESRLVFMAPNGMHVVGLAVSAAGRVALSLWRDGFVDLALVEWPDSRLVWLTQDAAQDLDPAWNGEEELIFRSDRSGVFDLYGLRPGSSLLRRMSATLGGAFSPRTGSGNIVYARLGGHGFDLAAVPIEQAVEVLALSREELPEPLAFVAEVPATEPRGDALSLRRYQPLSSLEPFGWLPRLELVGVEPISLAGSVSVLGQDASGDHSYSISAGFDPRLLPSGGSAGSANTGWANGGWANGGWANVRYDYRATDAFDLFQRLPPSGFGVQFGFWPHIPHLGTRVETTLGFSVEFWSRRTIWLRPLSISQNSGSPLQNWNALLQLRAAALYLPSHGALQPDARLDLIASRRFADLWGYGVSGPRLSAHFVWSASVDGGSAGAWLDASHILPPRDGVPFTTSLALHAGYRPALPLPLLTEEWAVLMSVAVRESLPIEWRYADGILALERLTFEARTHGSYDGELRAAADLSMWADLMVRYGAPISLGGSAGYANRWWYRLGVRVPL